MPQRADPAAAGSGLVSRESIRPGKLLPMRLATDDLLTKLQNF
jgi:hypothetical protein